MKKYAFLFLVAFITLTSCSDDDDSNNSENLELTKIRFTLVSQSDTNLINNGSAIIFEHTDVDGSGPMPGISNQISGLNSNEPENINFRPAIYQVDIELFSGDENVTNNFLSNSSNFQIFYRFSGAPDLPIITYNDLDENGNPIGLSFELDMTTGGQLRYDLDITILQNLNKNGVNVSDGNPENAEGDIVYEIVVPQIGRNL